MRTLKTLPAPSGAIEVITLMATSLLEYFERQLGEFITGKYSSPDLAMEREMAGAPSTNIACESAFGFFDRSVTIAPNMTVINRSTVAPAVKNKLCDYLSSLPEDERKAMLEKAYENRSISVKIAKATKENIHRELVKMLEAKERKKVDEISKAQAEKFEAYRGIQECGFWMSVDDMENALEKVGSITRKKDLVKANIRFRKTVWQQTFEPKWVLQFQYKNHPFDLHELKENLTKLICADIPHQV